MDPISYFTSGMLGMDHNNLLFEISLMEPRHRLGCHREVIALCDQSVCVLFEHEFKKRVCKFLEENKCEHPDVINLIEKEN